MKMRKANVAVRAARARRTCFVEIHSEGKIPMGFSIASCLDSSWSGDLRFAVMEPCRRRSAS
jgi:hypothetical protein